MSLDAEIEEILAKMSATSAELASLPPDAFEQRAALHGHLTELRAQAAKLRTRPPAERAALRDRLQRLEAEYGRRAQNRVSASTGGQTGMGGGIDPEYVHALNREIDRGQGIAQLQAEIKRIRLLLAED